MDKSVESIGQAGASTDEIYELARRLYETMEELDPSDITDYVEWDDLEKSQKEFYFSVIQKMSDYRAFSVVKTS